MGRGGDIRRGGGRGGGKGRVRVSDLGSNNTVGRSDTGADESMPSPIGGGIEDRIEAEIESGNENIPHAGDGEFVSESSQRQVTGTDRTHEPSHSSHKTYIVPMGDMFDEQKVMKSISNILKEMFSGSWPTWTKVPKSDRELMWQRFQGLFEWDPLYDVLAKKNWDYMMGLRHRDLMRGTRDAAKRKYKNKTGLTVGDDLSVLNPFFPEWIDEDNWATMIKDNWNTQSWKKVSTVNKRNRGISEDGEMATHSGGSCSMMHTQLKMEKKKGGPVSFIEVYDDYHTKKVKGSTPEQPPQYTTKKAKNAMVNYKRLALEKSASISLNINPTLWEQACGGKKKGRMFGATKDILHLSSSRTLSSSSSTSQVARVDEVQKLQEQLVESQGRERAREADLKIMQEQIALLTKAWKDNFPSPPN